MKELQITKNGEIKKLQCIEVIKTYDSFKEIYNLIKNRMCLLLTRYKKEDPKLDDYNLSLELDDGYYNFDVKDIYELWMSKNVEEAWIHISKLNGECLEGLFGKKRDPHRDFTIAYLPYIYSVFSNGKEEFHTGVFTSNEDYLIIDKDDLTKIYKVNYLFIDNFALEV